MGYDVLNPDTPPEQSEAAYRMAYDEGFRILLCDLQFTKDNVPVCFHDETINRIARTLTGHAIGKPIFLNECTYDDILEFDYGIYKGEEYAGIKLMRLEEMFLLCEELGVELYIEIKAGNDVQLKKAVELSKQYDVRVSWAGSTYEQCSAIIRYDQTARIATMPRNISDTEIDFLNSLKTGKNEVFIFAWENAILNAETVLKLQENDIAFEMGTIDTRDEIINYWNESYLYCSGIESNCIVANNIELGDGIPQK